MSDTRFINLTKYRITRPDGKIMEPSGFYYAIFADPTSGPRIPKLVLGHNDKKDVPCSEVDHKFIAVEAKHVPINGWISCHSYVREIRKLMNNPEHQWHKYVAHPKGVEDEFTTIVTEEVGEFVAESTKQLIYLRVVGISGEFDWPQNRKDNNDEPVTPTAWKVYKERTRGYPKVEFNPDPSKNPFE